jgi:hypothetical protein
MNYVVKPKIQNEWIRIVKSSKNLTSIIMYLHNNGFNPQMSMILISVSILKLDWWKTTLRLSMENKTDLCSMG